MAFTLVQLQHFTAVVRYGSFSAAARALGVAQPAISQSVAALEEDLGARLFDRNSRKCTPTAAGLTFAGEAAQILSSVSESREKLRQFQTGKSGRVILGLTPGISNLIGEHLLRHMHETSPGLDVIIVEAFMTRLYELLLEERVDCIVTYGLDRDTGSTRAWALGYEPFCLVGAPRLFARLSRGDTVSIEELSGLPLFLATLSYEEGVGRLLINMARKHGIELDVRHQVQSLSLIRRLLLQKDLATITPIGAIIDELYDGRLQARPMADPAFMYPVQFAIAMHRNFGVIEKAVMNSIITVAQPLLFGSGIWTSTPDTVTCPDARQYFEHATRAPRIRPQTV